MPEIEQVRSKEALEKELNSLKQLSVYEEVREPENCKTIGCRWVFKKKVDADGNLRYRARLVAKGYSQTSNDYNQVFAPALRPETLRFVLTYATKHNLVSRHVDIETAYLYAYLQHTIYMKIPPSIEKKGKCWLLRKNLYGLRHSGYEWNQHLSKTLKGNGFSQGKADPCLFI